MPTRFAGGGSRLPAATPKPFRPAPARSPVSAGSRRAAPLCGSRLRGRGGDGPGHMGRKGGPAGRPACPPPPLLSGGRLLPPRPLPPHPAPPQPPPAPRTSTAAFNRRPARHRKRKERRRKRRAEVDADGGAGAAAGRPRGDGAGRWPEPVSAGRRTAGSFPSAALPASARPRRVPPPPKAVWRPRPCPPAAAVGARPALSPVPSCGSGCSDPATGPLPALLRLRPLDAFPRCRLLSGQSPPSPPCPGLVFWGKAFLCPPFSVLRFEPGKAEGNSKWQFKHKERLCCRIPLAREQLRVPAFSFGRQAPGG
ncbi:basic proline-rich protein-like [Aquila chrysaetos chrysaetos]|uniref:basic proline-rich protein-like n=1 Tax=Aquila chrysaetos chrysaetos TaxID=223781 RepID=UPI00117712BD|nr:basic proline-rich protein-like [Aquila chrysaetos chrysaetos]